MDSTSSLRGAAPLRTGDPDILVEIVGNLLDNSLKHARGARATITIDESSSGLRVSVTDTGPGIPPELRGHVFEPGARGLTRSPERTARASAWPWPTSWRAAKAAGST